MSESPVYKTVDKFDRAIGSLQGIPDVTKSKPTTIVTASPLIGESQTFVVQTIRQPEVGDWVFIQYMDSSGSVRMAIPPKAADAIARQREAVTTKVRRRVAKEQAAQRKARGEVPAFMKGKKSK